VNKDVRSSNGLTKTTPHCRILFRAVSFVTALAFFITSLPIDKTFATTASRTTQKAISVETFGLPAYLGRVQDSWKNSEPRISNSKPGTIIHIQDAHCNYAAQKKIAEIVKYLNKEYGINTVNLEGGKGDYDLTIFTRIKDLEMRKRVTDYFVKEGLVNGAEYFASNNPGKIDLWGVEETALYIENLNAYRDALQHKEEIDKHLKTLNHIISNLKFHIYPKNLLEVDRKYGQYKAGNVDLKKYVGFLMLQAQKQAIDIAVYPNLIALHTALRKEGEIDFKIANIERDRIIDIFQKTLSKHELEELVIRTVEFKKGKITESEFYAYLIGKAESLRLALRRFPEFQKYVAYLSTYYATDKAKIAEELDGLDAEIKTALYTSDTERELNTLSKNLTLMKNLFNVTLIRDDYEYYTKNESSFLISNYASFIKRQAHLYKIRAKLDKNIDNLDRHRENMARFYECSFKRDEVFLKNIRWGQVSSGDYTPYGNLSPSKATIIVTGGFHSENLYKLFKKNNISYISIMPNFKNGNGYESSYFKILSGEKSLDIAKILPSVLANALAIPDPLNPVMMRALFDQTASTPLDSSAVEGPADEAERPAAGANNARRRTIMSGLLSFPFAILFGIASIALSQGTRAEQVQAAPALSVPDINGRISHVAVTVQEKFHKGLWEDAKRAIAQMPPDMKITIIAHDSFDRSELAGIRNPDRVNVLKLDGVQRWAQDTFLVLYDEKGNKILCYNVYDKNYAYANAEEDGVIAELVARHNGWRTRAVHGSNEGGDFLPVGDKYLLVNSHPATWGKETEDFMRALSSDRIIIPIALRQHISLYVNGGWNNTIIVGDPRLGWELFGKADRGQRDAFEKKVNQIIKEKEGSGYRLDTDYERNKDSIERLARTLDEIAEKIQAEYSLKVIRVPSMTLKARGVLQWNDMILNYVSVQKEDSGNLRNVYLYKYGIDALDNCARNAWESMGYNVVFAESSLAPMVYGAGLQCTFKVLERGADTPIPESVTVPTKKPIEEPVLSAATPGKGMLFPKLYERALGALGISMSPAIENLWTPLIEEAGLLIVLHFWGIMPYTVARIAFVFIHGIRAERAPPLLGRERTFFEKIAIPLLASIAALLPVLISGSTVPYNIFRAGAFTHVIGNWAADEFELPYQKGSLWRGKESALPENSYGEKFTKRLLPKLKDRPGTFERTTEFNESGTYGKTPVPEHSLQFLCFAIDVYYHDTPIHDLNYLISEAENEEIAGRITGEMRKEIAALTKGFSNKFTSHELPEKEVMWNMTDDDAKLLIAETLSKESEHLRMVEEAQRAVRASAPESEILQDVLIYFKTRVKEFFTKLEKSMKALEERRAQDTRGPPRRGESRSVQTGTPADKTDSKTQEQNLWLPIARSVWPTAVKSIATQQVCGREYSVVHSDKYIILGDMLFIGRDEWITHAAELMPFRDSLVVCLLKTDDTTGLLRFVYGNDEELNILFMQAQAVYIKGKKPLDAGCGNDAILACVASRLGAKHVLAIDKDPDAVEESREYVELNGITNISVQQKEFQDLEHAIDVDVVIANIPERELVDLDGRQYASWHEYLFLELKPQFYFLFGCYEIDNMPSRIEPILRGSGWREIARETSGEFIAALSSYKNRRAQPLRVAGVLNFVNGANFAPQTSRSIQKETAPASYEMTVEAYKRGRDLIIKNQKQRRFGSIDDALAFIKEISDRIEPLRPVMILLDGVSDSGKTTTLNRVINGETALDPSQILAIRDTMFNSVFDAVSDGESERAQTHGMKYLELIKSDINAIHKFRMNWHLSRYLAYYINEHLKELVQSENKRMILWDQAGSESLFADATVFCERLETPLTVICLNIKKEKDSEKRTADVVFWEWGDDLAKITAAREFFNEVNKSIHDMNNTRTVINGCFELLCPRGKVVMPGPVEQLNYIFDVKRPIDAGSQGADITTNQDADAFEKKCAAFVRVLREFDNKYSLNDLVSSIPEPVSGDADSAHILEILKAELGVVKDRIRKFREFMQDRQIHLDLESVDVRALVREVSGEFGSSIEVSLDVSGPLPDIVGDRVRLAAVLENLFKNAKDAMAGAEKKVLSVTIRPADGGKFVEIIVADTGAGMDAETRSHAFNSYFTTKGPGGTGLGLAICREIIELHGGSIGLESEVGRGTRFIIRLPVVSAKTATKTGPAAAIVSIIKQHGIQGSRTSEEAIRKRIELMIKSVLPLKWIQDS